MKRQKTLKSPLESKSPRSHTNRRRRRGNLLCPDDDERDASANGAETENGRGNGCDFERSAWSAAIAQTSTSVGGCKCSQAHNRSNGRRDDTRRRQKTSPDNHADTSNVRSRLTQRIERRRRCSQCERRKSGTAGISNRVDRRNLPRMRDRFGRLSDRRRRREHRKHGGEKETFAPDAFHDTPIPHPKSLG